MPNMFLKFSSVLPLRRYSHFCSKISNFAPLRIDQCFHIGSYEQINSSTLGAKDRSIVPHQELRIDQQFHFESQEQINISTLGAKNRSIFPLWELRIDQYFHFESYEKINFFYIGSYAWIILSRNCAQNRAIFTEQPLIFLVGIASIRKFWKPNEALTLDTIKGSFQN